MFSFAAVEPQHTTAAIQHYLDELNGAAADAPSERLVRDVLARAVLRLRRLCDVMLHQQYPRLARGPSNLTPDELLGGVVERLLKAVRDVRPGTVRQFFALANRHMRWELNDLARRLDARGHAAELRDSRHAAPPPTPTPSAVGADALRVLGAVERLPDDEREVFTLMRVQGLTRADVAQVVGCAEKTVQRRLKRALIFLTRELHDIAPAGPSDPTDAGGPEAAPSGQ